MVIAPSVFRYCKNFAIKCVSVLCPDEGPKVLYYHDVFSQTKHYKHATPIDLFRRHINIISDKGYEVVQEVPTNRKQVMLTFDDGYKGIWDCREYFFEVGLKPTIFIAVDLVGKDGYLNWNEILELQKHGFVFQGHAWTHQRLTQIPKEYLRRELKDARACLSDRLGKEVTQLCFPYGSFSHSIYMEALDAGYMTLFSCIFGNANKRIMPNLICRNLVQEASPSLFTAIINGGGNFLWHHYYKVHYRKD